MIVVLFGPPGSGKGTQAGKVAAALSIPHVATGDIFRKHLKEGTDLGRLARSYMDAGGLVPDSVTCDMVADRLTMADAAGGVLFDGFPRTVSQARWLLGWLAERELRVDVVVSMEVPDAEVITRISGRRTCQGCGATWHVVHNPTGETCRNCGGVVVQRKDDAETVVVDRVAVYHRDTEPVLAILGESAPVRRVDGLGEISTVAERIQNALSG